MERVRFTFSVPDEKAFTLVKGWFADNLFEAPFLQRRRPNGSMILIFSVERKYADLIFHQFLAWNRMHEADEVYRVIYGCSFEVV